ncbi:MAG: DNA primase [Rhodothermales bacterium]
MRIPDDKIEEVRSAVDIVDVVSDYVALKKRGTNFFGLCPFHSEKTPSFSVNPERGIYKCFGCGKGGNVFSFLREIEKLDFVEAVRVLAERAGVTLPAPSSADTQASSVVDSLYHALRLAGRFYHHQLTETEPGKRALRYLEERGFKDETIRRFGIGYAPDTWDALIHHAEKESTSVEYLEMAGLVVKREKGDGYYDRFRGRVMFPLLTQVGQVVGFTGRILDGDEKQAKYVNTPETQVYHKGRLLYGLHFAKNDIRKSEEAYLVEGNTDVISMHQSGINNVVATSGTALTTTQVKLLGRYTDSVVLLFDADLAGVSAMERSIDLLLAANMKVRTLRLPEGYDPDSFIQKKGRDGFLIFSDTHKTDFVAFKLSVAGYSGAETDPEKLWEAIQSALKSIALIPNAVRQEGYLRLVAEQTGMPDDKLRKELAGLTTGRRRRATTRRKESERQENTPAEAPAREIQHPIEPREQTLVRLMLEHGEELIGFVLGHMGLDEFSEGVVRRTVQRLLDMYSNGDVNPARLLSDLDDPEVQEFAAGVLIDRDELSENWSSMHDIEVPKLYANARGAATDAMTYLKLKRVNKAIEEMQQRLYRAQADGNDVIELLEEMKSLQVLRKDIASRAYLTWADQ